MAELCHYARLQQEVCPLPSHPAWYGTDRSHSTLQVYYSKNDEPLKSAASAFSNDNSGNGQFQIGILKKPTGTNDVVNAGFQSKNLNEGLIYGSLFVEDSAGGCVSL